MPQRTRAGTVTPMTNNWMLILSQLAGQAPVLLVYVVGLILCALWSRRAPSAAMYAMIGCGLLLMTSVGVTVLQMYYINNRGAQPTLGYVMFVIGVTGSILRAVGIGLLLAGVFAGRPR